MSDKMYMKAKHVLVDQLSVVYHKDPVAVALVCDGAIDRSGALLGEVRERHQSIYHDLKWWEKLAWNFDQWRRSR